MEIAEPFDGAGGEPGFLLELLDRGALDGLARVVIADEAGGNFETAATDRDPRLVT